MKYIFTVLPLILTSIMSAQTAGSIASTTFINSTTSRASTTSKASIAGKLIDKEFNDEPLAFGNVLIKGTSIGTTSDIDGVYSFENLNEGQYTLIFSFVGYQTQELEITLTAGKTANIDVDMVASTASLDEVFITVTTRKES